MEWSENIADGCNFPAYLRKAFPRAFPPETEEQCFACKLHDRDYFFGGSRQMRRMADEMLRRRLIAAGMPEWRARVYWLGVRIFGTPYLHRFVTWWIGHPQSWGYGGAVFRYT